MVLIAMINTVGSNMFLSYYVYSGAVFMPTVNVVPFYIYDVDYTISAFEENLTA